MHLAICFFKAVSKSGIVTTQSFCEIVHDLKSMSLLDEKSVKRKSDKCHSNFSTYIFTNALHVSLFMEKSMCILRFSNNTKSASYDMC